MRILVYGINFHPEPTGVGKYSGEMAEWLAAKGHEVRVVTAPPSYPQWRIFPGYRSWRYSRERIAPQMAVEDLTREVHPPRKIEIFRCPAWIPRKPQGWKRLLHLASFGLSSVPALLRQIRWTPEIVLLVAPTLFCALQALVAARFLGAKSWLHVQDFEVDAAFGLGELASSRLRDWAVAVERRILQRFDRVSAISPRMVERLTAKGVEPSRCILFPNWVDTGKIFPLRGPNPMRKELGLAESEVVALYAGSMGKKQGLELLECAARMTLHRADLRFVICGEGPSRRLFDDNRSKLPNVTVLPVQPTERLNDLLNLADIHLLPQRADAADLVMPSKLTGMMASGRAVIATAHPGTQLFEVLEGTGMVTPPGDVDALVSALSQLVEDAPLRKQLGQKAREYAVGRMSRVEILTEFERSLMSVCGPPSQAVAAGSFAASRGKLTVKESAAAAGNAGED